MVDKPKSTRKRSNRRIAPTTLSYFVHDSIPIQMQHEIDQLAEYHFHPGAFYTMAEAVKLCAATWGSRKNALKKGRVLDRLNQIASAAARLKQLLRLDDDSRSVENQNVTPEAMYSASLVVGDGLENEVRTTIDRLEKSARRQLELVKSMRTLGSGTDSEHLDELLQAVREILHRNGLNTSYDTPDGDTRRRHGLASDIAAKLAELLPREIRLSHPQATPKVFVGRLVAIRHRERLSDD